MKVLGRVTSAEYVLGGVAAQCVVHVHACCVLSLWSWHGCMTKFLDNVHVPTAQCGVVYKMSTT